jgi:hypothetical protein
MVNRHRAISASLILGLIAGVMACSAPNAAPSAARSGQEQASLPTLALMGTIPIYWGEADSIEQSLAGNANPHWARAQLEESFRLQPLDVLDREKLAGVDLLLMAQPRALSGPENVALDAWVHDGGRLLLFADPLMTGHSRFAIGDRRRPQDVILLSPLLSHWGLDLLFDDSQPEGLSTREIAGTAIPVDLPGHFATTGSDCTLAAGGLFAACSLGKGRASILADAAVLDQARSDQLGGPALNSLVKIAFSQIGDAAGQSPAQKQ